MTGQDGTVSSGTLTRAGGGMGAQWRRRGRAGTGCSQSAVGVLVHVVVQVVVLVIVGLTGRSDRRSSSHSSSTTTTTTAAACTSGASQAYCGSGCRGGAWRKG